MSKKDKLEQGVYTNYWKHPEKGFPQRINWITVAGPWISEIQEYDIVFDQKDMNLRFPTRNKKLLNIFQYFSKSS